MRPQHIPYNYVPKFNQNSFPHWAVHSSQAPLSGSASQDRPLRCGRLQNLLAAQSRAGSIHHRSPSPCLSRAWGLDQGSPSSSSLPHSSGSPALCFSSLQAKPPSSCPCGGPSPRLWHQLWPGAPSCRALHAPPEMAAFLVTPHQPL